MIKLIKISKLASFVMLIKGLCDAIHRQHDLKIQIKNNMNKRHYLLVIIPVFFLSISTGMAQTVVVYNGGGLPLLFGNFENSAETSQKYKQAGEFLEKAYEAYEEGELEKVKYFLDQSEKDGVVSPGFYFLLGQYFFVKEKYKYAKRYWKRGFKKGCWECKEKIEDIPED